MIDTSAPLDFCKELRKNEIYVVNNPVFRQDVINTFYIIVDNIDFSTNIVEEDVKVIHCTILDTNLSKMLINIFLDSNDSFFMDIIERDDVALLLELEQNGKLIETFEDDFCDLVSDQFTGHTTIDKRLCGILLENYLSDLPEIVYYTTFVETTFLIDFIVEFH